MSSAHRDATTRMLRLIIESPDIVFEILTDLISRGSIQVSDLQISIDIVNKRHYVSDSAGDSCGGESTSMGNMNENGMEGWNDRKEEEMMSSSVHARKRKRELVGMGESERSGLDDSNNNNNNTNSNSLGKNWVARLSELKEYKAKYGNCNVPSKFREKPQLGRWVSDQRQSYKRFVEGDPSSMTEERMESLNHVGFEWSLRERAAVWDVRLEELRAYKRKYGNCNVPTKFEENPQLGRWVRSQRTHYKRFLEGHPSPMTEEHVEALNTVGFEWSLRERAVVWDVRFKELQEYKAKHGHCNVPKKFEENPKLGRWVSDQRTHHKRFLEGGPSPMTEQHMEALNSIGFEWLLLADWNVRFQELQQYKHKYSDCNVPWRFEENPKLGRWVSDQRTNYKRFLDGDHSTMTQERIDALNSIGFEWMMLVDWDVRLQQLTDFKATHGNCNVPWRSHENPQLRTWVQNQRKAYKRFIEGASSSITKKRIEALNNLGFEWSLR